MTADDILVPAVHCTIPAKPVKNNSSLVQLCFRQLPVTATPAEFKRSINEIEAEARGTAERLQQLQAEREHLQQQQAAAAEAWQQLQQQQ
jgi:hypothetical protein